MLTWDKMLCPERSALCCGLDFLSRHSASPAQQTTANSSGVQTDKHPVTGSGQERRGAAAAAVGNSSGHGAGSSHSTEASGVFSIHHIPGKHSECHPHPAKQLQL